MTDAEIVKAMEICKDKEIPCDDCPLVECGDCGEISRQYFYDRFKQLQSENAALRQGKKAAVEDVAERIKMAFYYEFDELIPSIMADKIDELVKEVCGDDNEQLKKKICDIIAPYVSAYGDDERIVDALISAGIGYIREAEHRAEVAERALRIFAENCSCADCPFFGGCQIIPDVEDDFSCCFDMYLAIAEKDLMDERK